MKLSDTLKTEAVAILADVLRLPPASGTLTRLVECLIGAAAERIKEERATLTLRKRA